MTTIIAKVNVTSTTEGIFRSSKCTPRIILVEVPASVKLLTSTTDPEVGRKPCKADNK